MAEAIAERRYPCPACPGELCWEPTRQALACTTCGATRPLEPPPVAQAQFIEPDGTTDTASSGDANAAPDNVLPFQVSEPDARACALRWVRSAWLFPPALARRVFTGTWKGSYVPFWLFDAHAVAHWEGSGLRGIFEMDFDGVAVCADRSADPASAQPLEPWPEKALQPYDPRFVAGWTVLRPTLGRDEAVSAAHARMEREMMAAARRNQSSKVRETMRLLGVEYPRESCTQALLPLWLFESRYLGRPFRIAVSGANGNAAGQVPKSPVKVVLLGVAAVCLALLLLDSASAIVGELWTWLTRPFA